MVDGQGGLRPHWRGLLGALTAYGDGGLAQRAARLDRAFDEEGITTLLPGAAEADRSWRCDPIPLLLSEGEFAAIEAGLAQRARLLQAVLGDIYGAQTLLADGALPPALVYANPGFLRPFCGHPRAPLLQTYAADIMRGPDGAWRVLADRTTDSAGLAYARENRRLLSRVLPEAFRSFQVRQLNSFFDVWQDALQRCAPGGKSNPTVALLTPGTTSRKWFEHMYLSRELNCALVEGGDLTVRGGALFLKSLKGLQQVDVLLLRMDGRSVDPLELEGSSALGVPGLIDAARNGAVCIVNDPGAGVLEAPALAAYLPGLCQRLLGERLELASVPTLWLGDGWLGDAGSGVGGQVVGGQVAESPNHWLIRPAFDAAPSPQSLAAMPPGARAALLARVADRPGDWVASAVVPPSVAPALADGGGMEPRPVVVRLFLVFDGAQWRAMPGGLARVMEPGTPRHGQGISKDVWVLSEDRADIVGPAALAAPPLRLRRTSGDLPSRVADNLFWLGRYVERLDRAGRLVRAAVVRLGRGSAMLPREVAELQALGRCLVEAGVIPPEAAGASATSTLAEALLSAAREGGAIGIRFAAVARLTESVRDRLTGDMYATFTHTLRTARADALAAGRSLDGLAQAMVGILRFATAVAGAAAENMVRGGGWVFLELGRRMERAQAVASEVSLALDLPASRIEVGLRLALELCDSAITYRSRYLNVLQAAPVLDLVLADQGNPRGLAFQLAQMHGLLDELADSSGSGERMAVAAAGLLVETETLVEDVLNAPDQAVAAAAMSPLLLGVAGGISALSDRITRRYFALLPAVQTVGLGSATGVRRGAA